MPVKSRQTTFFWDKSSLFYFHCLNELTLWTFFHLLVLKNTLLQNRHVCSFQLRITFSLKSRINFFRSRVSASINFKRDSQVLSFLYVKLHMYYIRTVLYIQRRENISFILRTYERDTVLYVRIDLHKIKEGKNMACFPSPCILRSNTFHYRSSA
jgi:hypothetical protein